MLQFIVDIVMFVVIDLVLIGFFKVIFSGIFGKNNNKYPVVIEKILKKH